MTSDWREYAACQGSTVDFFPEPGDGVAEAKAVCARCPVADQCLAYALANREHGVWGGTTERERNRLQRRSRRTPVTRRCEVCDRPYQTTSVLSAVCSKACRQKAYVQRHRSVAS